MMALGAKGTALIQSFEQFRAAAYKDQGGIWTAGWGHTGPDIVEGTTCTPYQASIWFDRDTAEAARAVLRTVDVPMTQNQFDALVSFTYNVGAGSEAHSTLIQVLNAGNYMMAAEQFLKWNHVNGQVSAGLTRRREAERALFLDTST
jgi:lysozyme